MIRERRGKWQIRVYAGTVNGKRKHLTETAATYDDAKTRERELELEVKAGRNASAARMTVEQLCNQWLKESGPDLSPKTLQEYRGMLDRHITPHIGTIPIGKLTTARLDELYADLRKKLEPQSIRHIHAVIRKAFNVAIRKGYLTRNPAVNASPPKVRRSTYQPPDPQVLKAFLTGLEPELAMYARLAAISGARRGELCALRWSDIDLESGQMRIARSVVAVSGALIEKGTKSDRERTVGLDTATLTKLKAHRQAEVAKAEKYRVKLKADAPVFTQDPGVAWRPDLASHRFRRAAKKAGLKARLHDLRHWAVTYGLTTGHSVRQVADRAGHADGNLVLSRYGHAVPSADQAIAVSLGALLDDGE